MPYTLNDLASALSATVVGNGTLTITGAAEPQHATPNDLAIATGAAYVKRLPEGRAQGALLAEGTDWEALDLQGAVIVSRPRYAMAQMSHVMDARWRNGAGVHPTAIIDETAVIGANAYIGPYTVIRPHVCLGENAWVGSHVSIEQGAVLGANATLAAGVRIGQDVIIGDDFIAHSNAVIGADGFSFVTAEPSGVENVRHTLGDRGDAQAQGWTRIHSLGSVSIGDNVELGAGTCIDRGTIRNTEIGNGTKCDNLVHIGHNVQVGNDVMLCGQVGIAGSSRIGNNVVLGGQTGVSDNTFVGDNVIAGGATKIFTNVPTGRVILGSPAVKMDQQMKINRALRKLPKLVQDIALLKKPIQNEDETP